jgi:integrase
MLEKYQQQPIRLADIPKLVAWMNLQLSSRTVGDRLSYLRKCLTWAIQQGYLPVKTINPLIGIKPAKVAVKPKPKPFTKGELSRIVAAFENHPLHCHYADFVKFLIATGVRPSEAIGLRWKHIDFSRNEIQIYESLSRGDDGSTSQRLRKGTKTNNLRVLPLLGKLKAVLEQRFEAVADQRPDSLVFTTLTGKVIDDTNFRDRAWKTVLAECGIEYRKPYNLRHSLLSHMIEDGVPLTGVAYIAGHSDTTMVQRTYGHMVNRPALPDLL